MKIQTKTILKTLDGQNIFADNEKTTFFSLGNAIANILTKQGNQKSKFTALKAFTLAQKFYNDKEVELDEADFKLLKDEIEQDTNSALIVGQVLRLLDEQEKEQNKN